VLVFTDHNLYRSCTASEESIVDTANHAKMLILSQLTRTVPEKEKDVMVSGEQVQDMS
jgi:hypothetical protein